MVVSKDDMPKASGQASEMSVGEQKTKPGAASFDSIHPPSVTQLDKCVHCGFCLPACPTYALWGEEMDSPRGRIDLMRAAAEGNLELDDAFRRHIDSCLGCMACVTACPSGVRYDQLIEATRAQLERHVPAPAPARLTRLAIFTLFPYRRRVRVAALAGWAFWRSGVADRLGHRKALPPSLASLQSLMPRRSLKELFRPLPAPSTPAASTERMKVGLLSGCVASVFFASVNDAAVRVLSADGCRVISVPQGCCGALSLHSGREEEGLAFARAMIDAWEATGIDRLVIDAAGCGSTVKDYGRILADDPDYSSRAAELAAKAVDITELLAELGPVATRHPLPLRVAYHDACHLAHAQAIRSEPREILAAIPGLEVTEIQEAEMCCGSAGIYNIVQPEAAGDLGRRKAAAIASSKADIVATANPGCLLQIQRHLGLEATVVHPIEIIDAAIGNKNPWSRAKLPAFAPQGAPSSHPPAGGGRWSARRLARQVRNRIVPR